MRWSFAFGLLLAALTVGCGKGGYGDTSSSDSGFADTGSSPSDDDDDSGAPPADDFDDGGFEEPGFEDDFDDYYDDGF